MRPGHGAARKVRGVVAGALLTTVVVLVGSPQTAQAASITVNTALDIAPNAQGKFPTDGKCSLRAAIQSAQNNSNANDVDCSTGAPVPNVLDTIQIDPSLSGSTLTLSYSVGGAVQPFDTIYGADNPLKIIGPTTNAANFKISGGNAVRPFIVGFLQSAIGDLTLANLTVQGGNATGPAGAPAVNGQGGAMYASEKSHLTFDNTVFTANSASKGGAIFAEAPTITNNGGAYSSNSATDDGGAVYLNSGPSILNGYAVLFASNTAADKGGAIATNPGNVSPLIHLERSLVRNNSTTTATNGGVLYVEPVGAPAATTFEFYDSTAYQNSSLFFSTATTQHFDFQRDTIKDSGNLWGGTGGGDINNSIVTGTNTCTYTANVTNFNGARNLMDPYNGAGDCGLNRFGPLGKITNMSASLAQNGGPEVQQTFAIFAGSNAIDNGAKTYCGTIDARSVPRGIDGNGVLNNPQTGDCDIGAYEYAKYVVNFVTGTSTANEGAGTKNVQVKLRILDPASSPTPSPITIPVSNQATSTATITNDFTLTGGGVTFPAGSVDGAIANLQVNLIQDNVAELFGEEAHLDLATNVAGVAVAEPNSHTLSIQDDDQAGVVVDDGGNGTNVAEATPLAGEDINVRLQSQPDRQLLNPSAPGNPASYGPPANVVMHVAVDRDCVVLWNGEMATEGDPFDISIANAQWQTGQTMLVRSVDDAYDEDLRDETVKHTCEIRYTFTSLDPIYSATQDAYEVKIADNDTAGVLLTRTGGPDPLRENTADAATYDLELNSRPDPGKPLPVTPRDPVTVTLDPSAGCDIGAGPGNIRQYNFTGADWDTAVPVTVTPVDDLVVQLAHQCTVTSSVEAGDPIYANLQQAPPFQWSPPKVSENIQDYDPPAGNEDDPPFAIVTTVGGDGADVDEGAPAPADKVTVVLERAPLGADVTFKLFANDDPTIAGPQVGVSKPGDPPTQSASTTFTAANWNIPQVMEINAIDDDYDEADTHPWSVIASLDSNAPGFSDPTLRGIVLDGVRTVGNSNIPVTIADDDTSAFDIRDTGGSTEIKENSSDDQVDVRLATHPYADVTVKVTSDAQCQVNGGSSTDVVIKKGEWNQAHLVDLHAVDDTVLEDSPHPCVLTFDATSTDALYDALTPATKDIDVIDDEQADIDIDTLGGVVVSEAGATDQFSVVLGAQPQSNVTVDFGHDGQTSSVPSVTFTPANWNVAKTVDIAAIQDDVDEADPHAGTVTFTLTTTAPGYSTAPKFHVDATDTDTMSVSVADDDTAGVFESKTLLGLFEGGSDDIYKVHLESQPAIPSSVTVALTATGLCSVSPSSLVLTGADWDQDQTVTVTPGSDDIDDDTRTCTISHVVTSGDPNYNGIAVADATGAVVDDDTVGVTVTPTNLTIAEGGASDTYTVVLTSQPTANVQVDPSETGLCTAAPTLTFTAADWDTPQTVTVTSGSDAIDHVQSCVVKNVVSSAAAQYDGLAAAGVVADITDDDTAAVVLSKTTLTLDENGADDTYTVSLATQPTADVTVTPSPSGLCTVSGALTFTPANWNVAQTVTVTPGNDSSAIQKSCTISHAITTTDDAYAEVVVPDVSGPVINDELAGVIFSKSALTLAEGGAPDTYTVALAVAPTADVSIAIGHAGLCTTSPTSLTFTTANWNVAQTVTVTPGDDAIDNARTCTVTHTVTSADLAYDGLVVDDASGAVVDDDATGVTASKASLSLTESGSNDTYTLRLTSQPTGNVTIGLTASGLCSVSPSSRTFTSANWNVAQTVTVTPGNDDIVHAQLCSIGHTITTADATYGVLAVPSIGGAVSDDDTAGATVSDPTLSLVESGIADAYTVSLTSQPTKDVTVTLGATGLCSTLPATLTFTAADWDQAQLVVVTPGNDDIDHAQSCTVTHTATSADSAYAGVPIESASGPVVDDDVSAVEVVGGALNLVESGAADTYTIVLGSEPTADVVVMPAASGLCTASGALTFTSADWDTPQTVTVTPGNDDTVHAQSCSVTHTVTSADALYAAITPASAGGPVADDDIAAVVLSKTSLTLAESGADDTYSVRLATKPTADVTLTVSDAGLCGAAPGTLTFTAANWNTTQVVTVSPGNDAIVHSQSCTVSHAPSSTDPAYDGLAVSDATGPVAEDDVAGVTASKASLVLAESGSTDAYTLVLTSQPTSDVTIGLSDAGLCTVSPSSRTFTGANWNTPQTVTVTPGNDDLVHAQMCVISHTVTSADPGYDGLVPADVGGAVTDDDTAGVSVSDTSLSLTESGADDSYTLVLTSQPTADVTVAVSASGLCSTSPSSRTFTSANWASAQSVTVTPGNDDIVHAQSCTVHHTVTSTDANFDAASVADAVGSVADDDTASVDVSTSALTLTESGAPDTFTVVLGSQPTSDVVVTPSAVGLCTVSGALTFTAADWASAQTVTVTPGNDDIVHAQSCAVTNAVTSADPAYAGSTAGSLLGAVTDDDTAGVQVTAGAIVLHEATPATTGSYSVVLTSQPVADVIVALATADGQTTLDKASLSFTAADWNVAQTVTVTVVDDTVAEVSPHGGTITNAVSSADPAYAVEAADVTVSIGDDETATDLVLSAPADDETAVTATATVSGGDAPRTGTVQFALDGTDVGLPVALSADVAELDLGILSVGPHEISATYSGDPLHDGSLDVVGTDVGIVARSLDDTASLDEDAGPTTVDVLANDKGVDAVEPGSWSQGAHGTVACTSTGCTYTPDADFNGSDSFTYRATNGTDVTDPAQVEVTVAPVNDSPAPGSISVSVVSGQSITFDLVAEATDVDGDPITVASYGQPAHGTVTCTTAGTCTYTPDAGYSGPDSFTYVLTDGIDQAKAGLQTRTATRAGTRGTTTGTVQITVVAPPATTTTTPGSTTTVPGSNGGGSLPRTGTDPIPLVGLGSGLVVVGALVYRARRRLGRFTSSV